MGALHAGTVAGWEELEGILLGALAGLLASQLDSTDHCVQNALREHDQ